jgi:hypothetical protein
MNLTAAKPRMMPKASNRASTRMAKSMCHSAIS